MTKPRSAATESATLSTAAGPGRSWLLPAALIAVGIAVYLNSFSGRFFLDDYTLIVFNEKLHDSSELPRYLAGCSRPVAIASFAANYAFGGASVWGYHLVNLVVHLSAACVLFGIVRRTVLHVGGSSARAAWIAFGAALLWMVHPLQTQGVTYIVQRCESLMALFYLLTLYCVIRGAGSRRAVPWYAAAVAASAFGMGTKAVMVTAPVVILLYDRVFLAASMAELLRKRGALYAGLGVTWGVLVLNGVAGDVLIPDPSPRGHAKTAGFGYAGMSAATYALSQLEVVMHYIRLALWPRGLCLDHRWHPVMAARDVIVPALGLAALAAGTAWALWRMPWLGFLGAAFFLILAPSSSIVPIQDVAAEHRMYLPLAALVVALVIAGDAALSRLSASNSTAASGAARVALLAAVACPLAVLTVRRNDDYADPVRMWQSIVRRYPESPRGHTHLGRALRRQQRLPEAAEAFYAAQALRPLKDREMLALATVLFELGRYEEAAAAYGVVIETIPSFDAQFHLGVSLLVLGRYEAAVPPLRAAVRIRPTYQACVNLGSALARLRQFDEAAEAFMAALRVDPQGLNAQRNLGLALMELGRRDAALEAFQTLLRLSPEDEIAAQMIERIRTQAAPEGAP